MKRRDFLKRLGLGSAVAAAAVTGLADAEALFASTKKYFLPPAQGWKPKTTAEIVQVAAEGIQVQFARAYDTTTNTFPCRFDVLYGYGVLRPDLEVRTCGMNIYTPTVTTNAVAPMNERFIVSGGNGYIWNVQA